MTTPGTPAGSSVTPELVCALVDLAQMSQITGFTITSTKTSMSGTVSVCEYIGKAADNYESTKVFVQYQPDGKTAVEYTKAKGEAVPGLGLFAVYFKVGARLSVEVGGEAVLHVFMFDTRANHGDPKGAAVQIAQTAVPRLPSG